MYGRLNQFAVSARCGFTYAETGPSCPSLSTPFTPITTWSIGRSLIVNVRTSPAQYSFSQSAAVVDRTTTTNPAKSGSGFAYSHRSTASYPVPRVNPIRPAAPRPRAPCVAAASPSATTASPPAALPRAAPRVVAPAPPRCVAAPRPPATLAAIVTGALGANASAAADAALIRITFVAYAGDIFAITSVAVC